MAVATRIVPPTTDADRRPLERERASSVLLGTASGVVVALDLGWLSVIGAGTGLLPFLVVLAAAAGVLWGVRFGAAAGGMAAAYALVRGAFDPQLAPFVVIAAAGVAAGAGAGALRGGGLLRRDAELRSVGAAAPVRVLGDAAEILTSSLEVEETAERFLDRLIPDWADWGTVDVTTPRGEVRRLASAHESEAGAGALRALAAYPPELLSDAPISRVLRSGRPVVVGDVDPGLLARIATDERHHELLAALEPRSALVLPLVSRKRMVGAFTLVRSNHDRTYTERDLELGMQLADRLAVAIDNAQLFHEAAEATQAKADFLAVMSHELRTPLSAILGYVDLLEAEIAGPITAEQRDQIVRIRASSWHLADLVDEVLSYARIEAGQEGLRVEEVDLGSAVAAALRVTRPAVEGLPVEMEFDPPADPVRVTTDPARVRQILVNLLSNAAKFTDQGTIRVEIALNDLDGVTVTVSDTGVGIARSNLDRIFEPFWQADQGPTRSVGGTGLGLAVARRLARMLGGNVVAESTLGKGSRFHLMLPHRSAPAGD